MRIIPAVDIMDHRVVQLVGGVPGSEKITMPDPIEAARMWINKGADYLHIVDLDGAFGKENNIPIIKKIIQTFDVPVEIGGGIKDAKVIGELIDVGAERIILGTKAIKDNSWLSEMASMFPGKILLALDTKNNEITMKGWQEAAPVKLSEMFARIKDLPLAGVLNTNVDVEGQGKGINVSQATDFISKCPHPVVASGGVSSEADAKILSKAGAEGAVVGVSIYTEILKPWEWTVPWHI